MQPVRSEGSHKEGREKGTTLGGAKMPLGAVLKGNSLPKKISSFSNTVAGKSYFDDTTNYDTCIWDQKNQERFLTNYCISAHIWAKGA